MSNGDSVESRRTPMAETPSPSRLGYTRTELARRLGRDPKTVAKWIKRGDIHAVRVGRLVLISADEVERFLADGPAGDDAEVSA
jgi:excisionase family DNA binding protein